MKNKVHGITLIEIMLIFMLLSIVIAIFVRIHLDHKEHPVFDQTQQDILMIENAMKFYKLDNGFYPTTAQGIPALVKKPSTPPIPQHWTHYLKTVPIDQWGQPYHYNNPGRFNEIDIYSDGPPEKKGWWSKIKFYWKQL